MHIVANVFANYFMQGITEQKFYRTNFINTVELKSYNSIRYTPPINGFNNMNEWSTTRSYVDSCQNYGWRYGSTNQIEFHQGIDIPRPNGTAVFSSLAGNVIYAGYLQYYGNVVHISRKFYDDPVSDSNDIYHYFVYQHLNSYSVSPGVSVQQNQQIGTVGNTGDSYGNHLHYSISTAPEMDLESRGYLDPFPMLQNQAIYYN